MLSNKLRCQQKQNLTTPQSGGRSPNPGRVNTAAVLLGLRLPMAGRVSKGMRNNDFVLNDARL
jgi:hypothetical protein